MRVQSEWLRYVRYAVIVTSSAVALRSQLRLMRGSINADAFFEVAQRLINADVPRLAKLAIAGERAPLTQMVLFALALRVPMAATTTSESPHFRDAGPQGEPYELRWKRALDRAYHRLRRELSFELGLAVGGLALAAIVASLGALMTADKREFIQACVAMTLLMMFMFAAANTGRTALIGLSRARAFCDQLRVADEQRDEQRVEASTLAERSLRDAGRALDAHGALNG